MENRVTTKGERRFFWAVLVFLFIMAAELAAVDYALLRGFEIEGVEASE